MKNIHVVCFPGLFTCVYTSGDRNYCAVSLHKFGSRNNGLASFGKKVRFPVMFEFTACNMLGLVFFLSITVCSRWNMIRVDFFTTCLQLSWWKSVLHGLIFTIQTVKQGAKCPSNMFKLSTQRISQDGCVFPHRVFDVREVKLFFKTGTNRE